MWFLYVISAISMSIGAGALKSSEVAQKVNDQIHATAPAHRAEYAARTQRSLRRMHQINSGRFPQPKGNQISKIPANLVSEATPTGMNIPQDVIFEIDRFGNISSRLNQSSKLNKEKFSASLGHSMENGDDMNLPPRNNSGGGQNY